MRTVTAQDILLGVAAKAGLDITDGGFAALQRPTVLPWLDNLGDYLAEAWEMYPWPDLMVLESRYCYEGPWVTGQTVPAAAVVYHIDRYWLAQIDTATEPGTSAAWVETDLGFGYLPLRPMFYDPIGQIDFITAEDPRVRGFNAKRIEFGMLDGSGCHFRYTDGPVWVRYKRPAPIFMLYQTGTYNAGDGVYDANDGSFYVSKVDDNGQAVPSAQWEPFGFPTIFRRFLVFKVFAQWLRSEKRLDEAAIASNQAEAALDHEIRNLINQGQVRPNSYNAIA